MPLWRVAWPSNARKVLMARLATPGSPVDRPPPNPISHYRINVHDHHVAPIGGSAVTAWPVNPEGGPEKLRKDLWRQRAIGKFANRTAKVKRHPSLATRGQNLNRFTLLGTGRCRSGHERCGRESGNAWLKAFSDASVIQHSVTQECAFRTDEVAFPTIAVDWISYRFAPRLDLHQGLVGLQKHNLPI